MTENEEKDLAATGTIDDGVPRKLDRRAIALGRISGLVGAAVLAFVSLLGLLATLAVVRPPVEIGIGLTAGWMLVVGTAAAYALVWPALAWKHASYRVASWGIEIRRGVVFRDVVTVPRSRVQHTDVSQGPLERSFGLATLILHTAGTIHAAVPLEGLAHGTAVAIRDHFVAASLGDAV